MKQFLGLAIVLTVFGCHSTPPNAVDHRDTVIVAYNSGGWTFNKAIAWTHTQRTWVGDSGLDAKMEVVTQFALRLKPLKGDSIIDSATHRLLRVTERYQPTFLPDTLSHYIHILDTLHTN